MFRNFISPSIIAVCKKLFEESAKDSRGDLAASPKDADGKCIPESVTFKISIDSPDGLIEFDVNSDMRVDEDAIGAKCWPKVKWDTLCALALSKMNDETRDAIIRQWLTGDVASGIKRDAVDAVRSITGQVTVDRRGAVRILNSNVVPRLTAEQRLEQWEDRPVA